MGDRDPTTPDRARQPVAYCRAASRFLALVMVSFVLPAPHLFAAEQAGRIEGTPDMLQVDPRLPDAGAYYCGPVALSNGFMWLAQHDFPRLAPDDRNDRNDPQVTLTLTLASNSYLKTFANKGTSTPRLMSGALRYLKRQGYDGQVAFTGWRTIERQFRRQLGLADDDPPATPDLKQLKSAVARKDTAIVLDIGWYRHAEDSDDYTRLGGHWVTLVGFAPATSDDDPPTLIIHNPDPAAGREPSHDRITWHELAGGALRGDFQGLPMNAKGFGRVEGLPQPKGADVAILDGIVIVQVKGGE